jgi:translation initiation factor eIF-2B subunit alpha/methylthioribose-1-phosphate isomerase
MKINGEDYRTVWLEDGTVKLIDQTKLPHKFSIKECKNYGQTAKAIKNMLVRGAPAIGAAAGYGIAQAAFGYNGITNDGFWQEIDKAKKALESSRPTAIDLFHSTARVISAMKTEYTIGEWKDMAVKEADQMAEESVVACMHIGEHGNELISEGSHILTHCNAGALAAIDWGTALAPMRMAHNDGKKFFVLVDETRPLCQGSRLTAWELQQEGIPYAVIADNAAGFYLQGGKVNLCIVGADRITANGDVANKIGTYEKAVLAKENNVPFYVAAPLSTIDMNMRDGSEIPIEERPEDEVLSAWGALRGGMANVRIAPEQAHALNPAFDVTPAKYITGIITEKGIVKPGELATLFA